MHEEAVKGVADAHPAGLGVMDDGFAFLQVGGLVEVSVHDAGAGFDHGHLGVLPDKIDQALASPRNQHIHVADRVEQRLGGLAVRGEQGHNSRIDLVPVQHPVNEGQYRLIRGSGIAPTFQHAGITSLQAQRKHVKSHVGPGFVDNAHHPQRHPHLRHLQPVRKLLLQQHSTERGG